MKQKGVCIGTDKKQHRKKNHGPFHIAVSGTDNMTAKDRNECDGQKKSDCKEDIQLQSTSKVDEYRQNRADQYSRRKADTPIVEGVC